MDTTMDDLGFILIIVSLAVLLLASLTGNIIQYQRGYRIHPPSIDAEDSVGLLGSGSSKTLNRSMTIAIVDENGTPQPLSRFSSMGGLATQTSVDERDMSFTRLASSSTSTDIASYE
jgi:hypothetical protein